MKPRLRYIGLLFRPSSLSLSITLGITALFMAITFWAYGLRDGALYNYWYGPGSAVSALQQQSSLVDTIRHTIFSNPTFNKVLFYVMWLVLGLIVYEIIMAIRLVVDATIETVAEDSYVHSSHLKMWRRLGPRFIIRGVVLGCWLIYTVFFLKLLMPFTILAFKIWIGQLGVWTAWLYALIGVFVLLLSLHLHTVFLRLFALRVRLSSVAEESLLDG